MSGSGGSRDGRRALEQLGNAAVAGALFGSSALVQGGASMSEVRHKVFISYYHDDQDEVAEFIETFDQERKVFITRALGTDIEQDIIDSTNTDYVMRRIRELYLRDSTVTIVMIGRQHW